MFKVNQEADLLDFAQFLTPLRRAGTTREHPRLVSVLSQRCSIRGVHHAWSNADALRIEPGKLVTMTVAWLCGDEP
jgi:hypothetical protein